MKIARHSSVPEKRSPINTHKSQDNAKQTRNVNQANQLMHMLTYSCQDELTFPLYQMHHGHDVASTSNDIASSPETVLFINHVYVKH